MEYKALYRKYRPQRFSEVIGQEHITTILKNQIASGQVSHAYLFSGSRGTGKTSTAKILSRAVNCLSPIEGEPCLACDACKESIDDNVDIIELDAASNNRVDDMRALIEKAVFSPIKMRKKVYIIDEAHMITSSAFNALLKTLEEPPAHVLFILATTEPHKIIPTIASRCQRFEFRRLKSKDIIQCLTSVLSQVGATVEHEGLLTIASKANGGMRDALSLADQCISFCGNNVSTDDVHHILGSLDSEHLFKITDALNNSNTPEALKLFDEMIAGRDIPVFVTELTSHFRALLYGKLCGSCSDILDCTEDFMKKAIEQGKDVSKERLMRSLDILTNTQAQLRLFPQPRILVEAALIKICSPETEETMLAAFDRINVLEKQIAQGAFVAAKPAKEESKQESKQEVKQEKAKEPVKKQSTSTQKNDDAKKIMKRLAEVIKEVDTTNLLSLSLRRYQSVEILGERLIPSFSEKAHCNLVSEKENKDLIQAELDKIQEGLVFAPRLVDSEDSDSTVDGLLNCFEQTINIKD